MLFRIALAVHVAAGLTCVVSGALAAAAGKRPGRHPSAGLVYLAGLAVVFATATVLSALRWRADRHLFVIATVAAALGGAGWLARRQAGRAGRIGRRWMAWHGAGLAGSYIALLTGFYVDNGERLPLWNRLPHVAYWVLPAAVGIPLTWWALRRNGALHPRRGPASAAGPGPRIDVGLSSPVQRGSTGLDSPTSME
jgi:hypothetical protein